MSRIFAVLVFSGVVAAQTHTIDPANSTLIVHAYKSGIFSFIGHDHDVAAPIASGTVTTNFDPAVWLKFDAHRLKVIDAKGDDKEKEEIRQTMMSEKVLDTGRYPEITFVSVGITAAGLGKWSVTGNLTLHGQTRPVIVAVTQTDTRYIGSARISQRDFGIAPISLAGGTIKVKDEVKIEFSIALKD